MVATSQAILFLFLTKTGSLVHVSYIGHFCHVSKMQLLEHSLVRFYRPHPKDDRRYCLHFVHHSGGVTPSGWWGVPQSSPDGGYPRPGRQRGNPWDWMSYPLTGLDRVLPYIAPPSSPDGEVPPSFLMGVPYLANRGVPHLADRGTPILADMGVTPSWPGWGYPKQDWIGYPMGLDGVLPPCRDWMGVLPLHISPVGLDGCRPPPIETG